MANRERPMSPHLQVYRMPLLAMLSIAHRGSGILLSIGALVLAWWLMSLSGTPDCYAAIEEILGSWLGKLALFAWTFALYYHMSNGIRHLFWDAGQGYELETANKSGKLVLAAAAVLTVGTWVVALA